jgi:acetyl-CoA carboxylase biotin carboxylase subunit
MFKKILIANRGEIALRVLRTAKEMGIKTVAVYSTADKESLAIRFADEAVCIGGPRSSESYLDIQRIMAAAEITNADAIHPGYGFLAENAEFSEICAEYGIKFIGPNAEMIRQMGDKITAKTTMKKAGVPVIPGSEGLLKDIGKAKKDAERIGYPVILKATAGGGGKGMRIVWEEKELENAFQRAAQEAEASFGNAGVYMEKYIEEPRHIEIQIMGDQHGNAAHLSERDCSVQRRHQKLVEEAPSPFMDDKLRKKMGAAAIKAAEAIGYESVGTVEFLVDKQILIAGGSRLTQDAYFPVGHSIECRINAEDPRKNFAPCPGRITNFHSPKGHGVRVDTHASAGYSIPPYYDSMIAKLIVRSKSRPEAIAKMRRALDEFIIEGIATTIPFHKKLMMDPRFVEGNFDTSFMNDFDLSDL